MSHNIVSVTQRFGDSFLIHIDNCLFTTLRYVLTFQEKIEESVPFVYLNVILKYLQLLYICRRFMIVFDKTC